jgi:mRNA-degrading endonuclease RelE of RelBE toxin-antitoxin system
MRPLGSDSLYDLRFTADAVSDIKRLPKNIRNSLRGKLEKTVQKDPSRCSQPLAEPLAGFRSFHFGNYRVVLRVYEDLKAIAVVGVGAKAGDHHAEIYKRLENLANTGKLADFVLKTSRLFSG